MTGKVASSADGRDTCMRVCMCVWFLPVVPPSLPSQHVHPLNICPPLLSCPFLSCLSSPPLSSSIILLMIIYFAVSFPPSYLFEYKCGWYACLCRRECPLCLTSELSDVFISVNTHTYTHCLFHSTAKLSSKGGLSSSSVAQAPHVPVGWGYKKRGGAEL